LNVATPEPRTTLPALVPWAATACLAALVACLGELWIIEKARTQLLRDQNQLANAALKSTENQLEAERILNKRELEFEAAQAPGRELSATLLMAQDGRDLEASAPFGAVVWDAGNNVCFIRANGLPANPGREFQLWLLGPGARYPADCGCFHASSARETEARLSLPVPVVPGCEFVLIEGAEGGAPSYREARERGVIKLATRPLAPKIIY
jgi:hypothetical protein